MLYAYYRRLFPAAFQTAVFAGVAHAVLVAIAARSVGLESLFIATLTCFIVLCVALPGGFVLLTLVCAFRLPLFASLLLFMITAQAITIWLEMFVFEIGFKDVSWQYGLISAPASVIAWYSAIFSSERNHAP